jgi:alpha/beta superfamily hydrolase
VDRVSSRSFPAWPGYLERVRPVPRPGLIVKAKRDQFVPTTTKLREVITTRYVVTIPCADHNGVMRDRRFKRLVADFLVAGDEAHTGVVHRQDLHE